MTGGPAALGAIALPGVTRSVARARRFTREVLGPDHPSLHDVQTCVSEGFTNAVLHTASGRGGTVAVTFRASGGVIVAEVTDDGAGGARPYIRDEPAAVHGRGLRIIDALTLAWGVHSDGDRTSVWMRFPGPVPAVPRAGGSRARKIACVYVPAQRVGVFDQGKSTRVSIALGDPHDHDEESAGEGTAGPRAAGHLSQ